MCVGKEVKSHVTCNKKQEEKTLIVVAHDCLEDTETNISFSN